MNETVQNTKNPVEEIKREFVPHRRVSIRTCANCGEVYIVSDPDMKYYIEKFDTIPLRCPKCREKRKVAINVQKKVTTSVHEDEKAFSMYDIYNTSEE